MSFPVVAVDRARTGRNAWVVHRPAFDRLECRSLLSFTPISAPDAMYLAETVKLPIPTTNYTHNSSLSDSQETITFSSPMNSNGVPDQGFDNWGAPPNTESASPRILYSFSNQQTWTFSKPVREFGLEMEQNAYATATLQMDFYDGTTLVGSVSRTVTTPGTPVGSSSNGALVFAASTDDHVFDRVVMTVPQLYYPSFAVAEVRYALDTSAPTIDASAHLVGRPHGHATIIPVTVSGTITDLDSVSTASYQIQDEYGTLTSTDSTPITVNPDGTFSFTIWLDVRPQHHDKDGRQYEIIITAVPSRSCKSRISRRICACRVTSSAVVGSSAIKTFGRHANAIAITTRCR